MKRILALLLLMAVNICAFAQKSYIHVYADDLEYKYQTITISGYLPSGIKDSYEDKDKMTIGNLLNLLSEQGFEVEYMCSPSHHPANSYVSHSKMCYLLSKKKSTSDNSSQTVIDYNTSTFKEFVNSNLYSEFIR